MANKVLAGHLARLHDRHHHVFGERKMMPDSFGVKCMLHQCIHVSGEHLPKLAKVKRLEIHGNMVGGHWRISVMITCAKLYDNIGKSTIQVRSNVLLKVLTKGAVATEINFEHFLSTN